jgi:hypothetical protein
VNTKEPTVTGSAVVGQTLTGTAGSWSGAAPITYTYQWLSCDAQAGNCGAISGQTSLTHSVTSDDVGHRLRFRVVAKNNAGSTTVDSNATSTVVASSSGVPVNSALPTISGSAVQGQILTASNGTWTGAQPITYTDQWLRCDANGNSCSSIANETKTTHTLTSDDVGHRLRVRIAAKNSSGTTTAQSEATSVVTATSGGGGGGQLPDGAVQLPSGKYSIPVAGVSLPTQLVVDKVKFSPNPVRSRTVPITVRVHIVDTRGYVVRDALVFIRTVPLLATTPPETPTAQDGWATMQIFPSADFPLRNRHFVQVFVRVRKADDPALAGVGTRRLVQVRTARPS